MRAAIVVAILCLAGACTRAHTARVGIRSAELMRHLDELGREGHAEIATVVVARNGRISDADRETVFVDQSVTLRGRATTLLVLATGCGPFAANQPCVLAGRPDDIIVLRTLDPPGSKQDASGQVTPSGPQTNGQNNNVAVVSGFLTLGSLGGMTICLLLCESNKGAKSVALGGASLLFAVVWAVASGGRD
jgi:hypothetical protein